MTSRVLAQHISVSSKMVCMLRNDRMTVLDMPMGLTLLWIGPSIQFDDIGSVYIDPQPDLGSRVNAASNIQSYCMWLDATIQNELHSPGWHEIAPEIEQRYTDRGLGDTIGKGSTTDAAGPGTGPRHKSQHAEHRCCAEQFVTSLFSADQRFGESNIDDNG